jgi:hypothetical protein
MALCRSVPEESKVVVPACSAHVVDGFLTSKADCAVA